MLVCTICHDLCRAARVSVCDLYVSIQGVPHFHMPEFHMVILRIRCAYIPYKRARLIPGYSHRISEDLCTGFMLCCVLLWLLPLDLLVFFSVTSWWRHQMETFSALLAICAGNSPVTGEFPAQRSVTRSFDVFFHLRRNKRLSKQSWGWWFETPSRSLWRHCNVMPPGHSYHYSIINETSEEHG